MLPTRLLLISLGLVLARIGGTASAANQQPVFFGKTIPQWVAVLKDADPDQRAKAARVLGSLGEDAKGRFRGGRC